MPSPTRRDSAWRVLLALLAALVAALALTPAPPERLSLGWDKINHLSAFGALAVCVMFGWRDAPVAQRAMLLALLAFGGAIELLQRYVPGRSAEWADLLADGIGIVAGALLALLARWWLRRRRGTQQSPP
ncbi:MAG TPA: VanZ family protein [Rubrivivax sp.]|nr:VanZ family protein [Rubrivivax sp.]